MNTADTELKRTPLYDLHKKLGGKIVPFAGWELPVQYSGVIEEHRAVRQAVGLFDVSHMGEIWVTGPESLQFLQMLCCNDLSRVSDGQAQYSALLNEQGGVIDDLIIYRYHTEKFLLCVNASNKDTDYAWIAGRNTFNTVVQDVSAEFGQLALQGPKWQELVNSIPDLAPATQCKPFHFLELSWQGTPVIVARTGYTGEDGVEIFVPKNSAEELAEALLEVGQSFGILPCGLGARDSLRLEACLPLHGHELGTEISALESGLGWIVKFDKGDFIGREALLAEKERGSKRRLVGLELLEPGIARAHDLVVAADGAKIGEVTSGTKTPWLQKALALALVDAQFCKVDQELAVSIRGRQIRAKVVKTPFYRRSK